MNEPYLRNIQNKLLHSSTKILAIFMDSEKVYHQVNSALAVIFGTTQYMVIYHEYSGIKIKIII